MMKHLLRFILGCYKHLLMLFPAGFRQQFSEEMQLDFEDHLEEASMAGALPAMRFLVREACCLPGAILRANLEEGGMLKVLRSQPVGHGLRGALAFGLAYALSGILSTVAFMLMSDPDNSIVARLQVYFFDTFHTEHGLELISMLPSLLTSLFTGLLIGTGLAVLFGDRESASRYILAGVMGWFLHDAVMDFMFIPTNLPFFLGTRHTTYLYFALRILSGAFLGLIFVLARSGSPHLLRWVAIGSLAYPVVTYLYVRLLFKLFIVETPWLFIALMALVALIVGSVFLIALRAGSSRHAPWLVLFGAASILLSQTIAGQVISAFFSLLQPELGVVRSFSWSIPLRFATMDAIYGVTFGLLLGSMMGFQRKIGPPKLIA
jgi:hypothetical protein